MSDDNSSFMSFSTCILANNPHSRQVWSITSIALDQEKPDSCVSCVGVLKKNQKSEFQFGKRGGKVYTKEVNGRKHLIDLSGSERQDVLQLSVALEFGENHQRVSRVCVLEQEMGQRYMDSSRIRVSYETVHIPRKRKQTEAEKKTPEPQMLTLIQWTGFFCSSMVAF